MELLLKVKKEIEKDLIILKKLQPAEYSPKRKKNKRSLNLNML